MKKNNKIMSDKLDSHPSTGPKIGTKEALKDLKQQVETLNTPERRTKVKIENHLIGIMEKSGKFRKGMMDGESRDILNATGETAARESAEKLRKDFEESLTANPKLFESLPEPRGLSAVYDDMIVWQTTSPESPNIYWSVMVNVNRDGVQISLLNKEG